MCVSQTTNEPATLDVNRDFKNELLQRKFCCRINVENAMQLMQLIQIMQLMQLINLMQLIQKMQLIQILQLVSLIHWN